MSLIWIEILIGFGVPIAWGVWQLIDLRRERERDAAKAAASRTHEPDGEGVDGDRSHLPPGGR